MARRWIEKPEVLAGALQGCVHKELGRGRAARAVRVVTQEHLDHGQHDVPRDHAGECGLCAIAVQDAEYRAALSSRSAPDAGGENV